MLSNALKRFMMEEIDAEDFNIVKASLHSPLTKLEAKLADMPNKADSLKTGLHIVIERFTYIQLEYKSPLLQKKERLRVRYTLKSVF